MKNRDEALSAVVRSPRLLMLVRFRIVLALVLVMSVGSVTTACSRKGGAVTEPAPEPPIVNDATTGLLLTWIDDKGEFHTEQRIPDVPESGRDMVRVRDPARDPLTGDRVFVADLRTARPDGSYAVRVVGSGDFEDIAVTRRAQHGIVLTPQAAGSGGAPSGGGGAADAAPSGAASVIIYGASWCGPCHQAAGYLKQKGIAFVEHDIEKDSSAAREMQSKLAKVGKRGGSIPVLDVRGHILVGFDARAVDQALAQPL